MTTTSRNVSDVEKIAQIMCNYQFCIWILTHELNKNRETVIQ